MLRIVVVCRAALTLLTMTCEDLQGTEMSYERSLLGLREITHPNSVYTKMCDGTPISPREHHEARK